MKKKADLESSFGNICDKKPNVGRKNVMRRELNFLDKFPEISHEVHRRIHLVLALRESGIKDFNLVGRNLENVLDNEGRIDGKIINEKVKLLRKFRNSERDKLLNKKKVILIFFIFPLSLTFVYLLAAGHFDRKPNYLIFLLIIYYVSGTAFYRKLPKKSFNFSARDFEEINQSLSFDLFDNFDVYDIISDLERLAANVSRSDIFIKAENTENSEFDQLNTEIEACITKFRNSVTLAANNLIDDRSMIDRVEAEKLIRARVESNAKRELKIRVEDVVSAVEESYRIEEEIFQVAEGRGEKRKVLK